MVTGQVDAHDTVGLVRQLLVVTVFTHAFEPVTDGDLIGSVSFVLLDTIRALPAQLTPVVIFEQAGQRRIFGSFPVDHSLVTQLVKVVVGRTINFTVPQSRRRQNIGTSRRISRMTRLFPSRYTR